MAIEQWIPRVLADPAQHPKKIEFSAEGTTWETWTAPFPPPDELVNTIKAVIGVIADESPKRRIPLLLTATADDGTIKSQCPSSVQGKNANADALGAGGSTAKAYADAMTAQASLMNTMLKAAENMVVYVTKVNESLTEQVCDLRDYQKAKQDLELLEKGTESGVNEFVMQQLKDASPLAIEAFGLFLESHKKSLLNGASKAASAVSQVTNGAPKS
ncbi:MAG TPA: hypothetical protein VNM39_13285 [Verrucomicrobiae bacterium]|nr:hypothetical protein [Verrucomicrobiae bacterium]